MKSLKHKIDRRGTLHLYEQAATVIREYILANQLGAGDPLPSTLDIASAMGINHLTVRKALQKLVDNDVITTIPGRGIYVAEGAVQKRVLCVGGVDPADGDVSPFYARSLRLFREKLTDAGYTMDEVWLSDWTDKTRSYCRPELFERYCGFVFLAGDYDHELFQYVRQHEQPYVHLSTGQLLRDRLVTTPDMFEVVCQMLDYFASRGHDVVQAFKIKARTQRSDGLDRIHVKARALNMRVRLSWLPEMRRKSMFIRAADQLAGELLASQRMPQAICITDDIIAQGVALALLNHGHARQTPWDIVVASSHADHMHLGVPVKSMNWDLVAGVAAAVDILHRQIAGEEAAPPGVLMPFHFCEDAPPPLPALPLETVELG